MTAEMAPRDAFAESRQAGDAEGMLATIERWNTGDSLSDDSLLELLMLFESPEFAPRKWRARLEAVLARVVPGAVREPARRSREMVRMALDQWRSSSEYGPQRACELAEHLLASDPADTYAFDLYLSASVADPYAHRGRTLEDLAALAADAQVRARLLLAHAFIDFVVYRARPRASALIQHACSIDPGLDYEPLRQRVLAQMGYGEADSAEQEDALPSREQW